MTKIKRRGVSLFVTETKTGWQVRLGNKIVSRHDTEKGADDALRAAMQARHSRNSSAFAA